MSTNRPDKLVIAQMLAAQKVVAATGYKQATPGPIAYTPLQQAVCTAGHHCYALVRECHAALPSTFLISCTAEDLFGTFKSALEDWATCYDINVKQHEVGVWDVTGVLRDV